MSLTLLYTDPVGYVCFQGEVFETEHLSLDFGIIDHYESCKDKK
jgi:hypothetical protein